MDIIRFFSRPKQFIFGSMLTCIALIQCNGQPRRTPSTNSKPKAIIQIVESDQTRAMDLYCLYWGLDINEFRRLNPQIKNNNIQEGAEIRLSLDSLEFQKLDPKVRRTAVNRRDTLFLISKYIRFNLLDEKIKAHSLTRDSTAGLSSNKQPSSKPNTSSSTAQNTTTKPNGELVVPRAETEATDFTSVAFGKNGLFKEITFRKKKYKACEIDPHDYNIELFNQLKKSNGVYTFASIEKEKKEKLLFAMNGGMYQPDLGPVGLFISEGKEYNAVNTSTGPEDNFHMLPNGIFGIDTTDKPFIYTTDKFREVRSKIGIRIATQSGPILVFDNNFHPVFKKESTKFNIRNGVGVNDKGHVVFIISESPVTFYEFAELFRDRLQCANALYLDGAISQIFIPSLNYKTPTSDATLGPILTVSKK